MYQPPYNYITFEIESVVFTMYDILEMSIDHIIL